jgi:hypothetical protein
VPHLPVEGELVPQIDHASIDSGADEALLLQTFQQVAVLPLLLPGDRREYGKPSFLRERENLPQNLFASLGRDGALALGTVPLANASVKYPQKIVNLGDRADSRAGIRAGGLL